MKKMCNFLWLSVFLFFLTITTFCGDNKTVKVFFIYIPEESTDQYTILFSKNAQAYEALEVTAQTANQILQEKGYLPPFDLPRDPERKIVSWLNNTVLFVPFSKAAFTIADDIDPQLNKQEYQDARIIQIKQYVIQEAQTSNVQDTNNQMIQVDRSTLNLINQFYASQAQKASSWYQIDAIMFYDKNNAQIGSDMFIKRFYLQERYISNYKTFAHEDPFSSTPYENFYAFTNFWEQYFNIDGKTWKTNEGYFQAGKFDASSPEYKELQTATGSEAFSIGQKRNIPCKLAQRSKTAAYA